MTRVAIDARKIEDYGIGSYIRGLVAALALTRPDWRFVMLGRPDRDAWPDNVQWLRETSGKYGLLELFALGRRTREAGADLFHAPHYVYPVALPCPGVVTIHDCIHLRFPEQLPRVAGLFPRALSRRYALAMMRHAARAARIVLTVSEASARDLVARVGVERARIRVVHNGCHPMFRRPATDEERAAAARVAPSRPYALFTGNDKPHKNLDGLLRAMDRLEAEPPLDLVVAGGWRPDGGGFPDPRVHAVGRVEPGTLRGLLDGARMAVVPSRYEGFGLPALEAMACGVPVVASAAGGLPEVVGEAGLQVPAEDDAALAEAMRRVRDDDALHARLAQAGIERARHFTWERAAELTFAAYDEALGVRS